MLHDAKSSGRTSPIKLNHHNELQTIFMMNSVIDLKIAGFPRIQTIGGGRYVKITKLTKSLKMTASQWIAQHESLILQLSALGADTVYKLTYGPPKLRGIYVSITLYHVLSQEIIKHYQRKITSMRRSKCSTITEL